MVAVLSWPTHTFQGEVEQVTLCLPVSALVLQTGVLFIVCPVPHVLHLCAVGLLMLPFTMAPRPSVEVLPNVSKIKDAGTGPSGEKVCVR